MAYSFRDFRVSKKKTTWRFFRDFSYLKIFLRLLNIYRFFEDFQVFHKNSQIIKNFSATRLHQKSRFSKVTNMNHYIQTYTYTLAYIHPYNKTHTYSFTFIFIISVGLTFAFIFLLTYSHTHAHNHIFTWTKQSNS